MKKSVSFLILEDQPDDVELMVYELINSGFVPKYQVEETEQDFNQHLLSSPDIILADYILPSFNTRRAEEILSERTWASQLSS